MNNEDKIKHKVKDHYASVARGSTGCCGPGCSCSADPASTALVDYGLIDVGMPQGANLGLGCGLPTLTDAIHPGDTVLDLGSGPGLDVFLAARQVGPRGRVIGVDMTPEMITLARENARQGNVSNVEFRLGGIEHLPVESASVDVVISNCVINLVPDKPKVFAEIYRVLKPGGRFSISDTVTYGQVPTSARQDMERWAGCISGAIDHEHYLEIIRAAGFSGVEIKKSVLYDHWKGEDYGLGSLTIEAHKRS